MVEHSPKILEKEKSQHMRLYVRIVLSVSSRLVLPHAVLFSFLYFIRWFIYIYCTKSFHFCVHLILIHPSLISVKAKGSYSCFIFISSFKSLFLYYWLIYSLSYKKSSKVIFCWIIYIIWSGNLSNRLNWASVLCQQQRKRRRRRRRGRKRKRRRRKRRRRRRKRRRRRRFFRVFFGTEHGLYI